jgi:uncharacterized protein YyaL (SSP411 family)
LFSNCDFAGNPIFGKVQLGIYLKTLDGHVPACAQRRSNTGIQQGTLSMPNRLAEATSPYLLQHKDNPVNWYQWSDEALQLAKKEDKPIFLSIGYSACHWCHVMEHESFENERIAAILNEHFVSIKVDREERPDLDHIYMQAVQMLTGSGGWPMSVFLKPDGQPFFGGTYWPAETKFGRPGFGQVLTTVADAWKNKREQLERQSEQITQHLREACRGPEAETASLSKELLSNADRWLARNFDATHGGFGNAPKFPHAMDLSLLLELNVASPTEARKQIVTLTLDKMAAGGIYDHLGGGFARYSVDARWLVPHFEKMLYDNSLLASLYADAFRLWGTQTYAQVTRETLDYILVQMTDATGAFYSTEDADSEGEEGKFYVWTMNEIQQVLGAERAKEFSAVYDVSAKGNFEGHSILNLPKSIAEYATANAINELELQKSLADSRKKLFAHRAKRVRPSLDDKVLVSWNALMITAMVKGYRALEDERYLQAAIKCAQFIRAQMRRDDGRLWHSWRRGKANFDAYLDDYSYLIDALAELIQVHADAELLSWSIELAGIMRRDFEDSVGGFNYTAVNHEQLIARSKDMADSSVPSGNSMAAFGLLTLGRLTDQNELIDVAKKTLQACSGVIVSSPQAAGQSLRALNRDFLPSRQWALIGGDDPVTFSKARAELLRILQPQAITIVCKDEPQRASLEPVCPLVEGRKAIGGQVTLYACTDSVCAAPIVGIEAVLQFVQTEDTRQQ